MDIKIWDYFIHQDVLFSELFRCCGGGLHGPASLNLLLFHASPEGKTHGGRKILARTYQIAYLWQVCHLTMVCLKNNNNNAAQVTEVSAERKMPWGASCFVCWVCYWPTYLDQDFLMAFATIISKYDFSIEFLKEFLVNHANFHLFSVRGLAWIMSSVTIRCTRLIYSNFHTNGRKEIPVYRDNAKIFY